MTEAVAAPAANAVKKDSTALLVLGIVTVVLGVLAMTVPLMAGAAVALTVGILLIGGGIIGTCRGGRVEHLASGEAMKFSSAAEFWDFVDKVLTEPTRREDRSRKPL